MIAPHDAENSQAAAKGATKHADLCERLSKGSVFNGYRDLKQAAEEHAAAQVRIFDICLRAVFSILFLTITLLARAPYM